MHLHRYFVVHASGVHQVSLPWLVDMDAYIAAGTERKTVIASFPASSPSFFTTCGKKLGVETGNEAKTVNRPGLLVP